MMKKVFCLCLTAVLALSGSVYGQNSWQKAVPLQNRVWSAKDSVSKNLRDDYYYRFDIRGESYLDIELALFSMEGGSGSFADISFYRLNADSTLEQIWMSGGSSSARIWTSDVGDTLRWRFTKRSDGTYFLRVNRSNTASCSFRARFLWDGGAAYPNDPEPNNDYYHAVEIKPGTSVYGHIGFVNHTTQAQDYYDCYKFTVERDCDVKLEFHITPCPGTDGQKMRLDMDSWQFRYDDSVFSNVFIGRWTNDNDYGVFDTVKRVRFKGLSAGTYYFRIYPSVGFGYYNMKLSVEEYQVPSDTEPNDSYFQAVSVLPGKRVYGHVGFFDKTRLQHDYYDCYKFTVDRDCDFHADFHIQPKGEGDCRFEWSSVEYRQDSLFFPYRSFSGDYESVWDTLKRASSTGLGKGTYYFRVYPSVGLATYDFSIKLVYPEIGSDVEPNDTWARAVVLQEGDTAFGHIGYDGAMDSTGFYRDEEDWYLVKLPSNGSINVRSQCYPGSGHGNVLDDHLGLYFRLYQVDEGVLDEIGYLSGPTTWEKVDTMTYNWKTTLGKGIYYLQVTPRGGFGQYKFVYECRPAPVADFDFIQHVNDKGQTVVCFLNRTTGGATRYFWKYDEGNWDYTYVANPTVVYDSPGVREVMLVAYGKEGNDTIIKYVEINGLQRVEQPVAGQGDVTLKFYAGGLRNQDTFLLEKDSVTYRGTLLRTVSRGCVEVRFHLQNAPTGKYCAIVRHKDRSEMRLDDAFTLEPAVEPEIYVDLLGLNKMLFNRWQDFTAVIGNKGNVDAYNRTLWIVTPDDSNCHIQFRNLTFLLPKGDTLQWVKDIPPYLRYDSMETGGSPVRIYPLVFSVIPAGTEVTVHFRMSSNKSEEIAVFTTEPFVTEALLKEYDSYESCVAWSIGKYVAEKAVGFLLDQIPGASCVKDVIKFTYQTTESTVEGNVQAGSLAWNVATTAWSCAKDFVGPLKAYKMTCDIIDLMVDIVDNYSADKECQKYKKKGDRKKRVTAVTSMDPNEMAGPSGFGAYNDVRKQDFTYSILFENKAAATAPAQEVTITDTLDKSMFDWHGIQFKSFGISDSIYTVQQSGLGFVAELDWDSVLVRVSGKMDTLTGVVRWVFSTLDPSSRELVSDPDAGFLKPNLHAPEGEGFVCFTIPLKAEVKDGDIISNRAAIVFDANEPILTNLYRNRIDENLPSSSITGVEETGTEGVCTVRFSGSDIGCGVWYYSLYMKVNEGERQLVSGHIEGDSYTLPLHKDSVYRFYLLATDSLSQREAEKGTADFLLGGDGIHWAESHEDANVLWMRVQPNPAFQTTQLHFRNAVAGLVRVEICNVLGSKVYEKNLGQMESGLHVSALNLSGLSQGLYVIRLQCGNTVCTGKLAVR